MKKYQIIYADPPWKYRDRASAGQRGSVYKYPVMGIRDIQNLNIASITDDNCALFLWVTAPLLDVGIQTLEQWGFKFKTVAFVWIKTTKHGKLFWGMGNWSRANAECVLLGIKGKIKRVSASVHSVIISQRGKHSEKPPEVRDRIVQLLGDLPRIELFAREKVEGWGVIGYEVNGLDIRDFLKEE